MKKEIILIIFVLAPILSFSQDRKIDTIHKLNKDSSQVFVINISEYDITYSFPGEQFSYTISRNSIEKIRYGNGRVEIFNTPTIISGENDWEKVTLTSLGSDIKGLKFFKEVSVRAGSPGGFSTAEKTYNEASILLKKQAASYGCHIVLIESKIVEPSRAVVITGKAYKY